MTETHVACADCRIGGHDYCTDWGPNVCSCECRAPVNGPPFGTIDWVEHKTVWTAYADDFGTEQNANRIAERGGFGLSEIVTYLGGMPTSWTADARTRRPKRVRT